MEILALFCCLLPLLIVLLVAPLVSYNRFVRQRNGVHTAWRQVDVELQRRHDLIPNLVDTVRGAAAFEQQVLQQLVKARTQAMAVRASHAHAGAQSQVEQYLAGALGGFFGRVEAYPQLRTNRNFLDLQRQLAETEDRIAAGRRFYNGNVREYNTRIEAFPSNIVASVFGFRAAHFFQVEQVQVRAAPQVGFSQQGYGQGYGQQPPTGQGYRST
ncbi:MAG: LemA family protein [Micromonosporaceae bacterium]